jgi:tetratricopeptide (TPR) repeat protein
MKKLITIALFLLAGFSTMAADTQLDSLKQKLQNTTIDSLKGNVYQQIAAQYLSKYDTIKHRGVKLYYQNEALNYTMLALHNYSYYADTLGTRTCFDYLAKVYRSQRKYSQAKWFMLQSNKISRDRKDTYNIITSLVALSVIKMENTDYKLAMRDLNEALSLSTKNNYVELEALVQKNYAFLYNRMEDFENGEMAAKKAEELYEKVKQKGELNNMALQPAPEMLKKVKKTPVINKKKVYAAAKPKKVSKLNTDKRLASL